MNNEHTAVSTDPITAPTYSHEEPHSERTSTTFLNKVFDSDAPELPLTDDVRGPARAHPTIQTNSLSRRSDREPSTPRSNMASYGSTRSTVSTMSTSDTNYTGGSTPQAQHFTTPIYYLSPDKIHPDTSFNGTDDNILANNTTTHNHEPVAPLDNAAHEANPNPNPTVHAHAPAVDLSNAPHARTSWSRRVAEALIAIDHDNEGHGVAQPMPDSHLPQPYSKDGYFDPRVEVVEMPEEPKVVHGRMDILKGQIKKIAGVVTGDEEKIVVGEELMAKGKREVEVAKEVEAIKNEMA